MECYNRSNARNAELEALLASKASVRITTPPPCASPMPDDTSTDNEAVDVHLVDTLQNELILKDKELLEVRNNYDAKLHGVNELLKQEKDSCAAMRFELRARPLQSEMLELQHEIGVLKSIVFSVDNPDVEESNGEGKATLETMLANKVKSLEKELTSNRIRIWSLEEEAVSYSVTLNAFLLS